MALKKMILILVAAASTCAADVTWTARMCNDKQQCCSATATVSDPIFRCTATTTAGTETWTLHPGAYVVPGNSMMLKTELSLGNRAFEIPVYTYTGSDTGGFFRTSLSLAVTADFVGNFPHEQGEYKIAHPAGSAPVEICDTKTGRCCTTDGNPGSCAIDFDQVVTLDDISYISGACGSAYSYYLFGKRNVTSGHSFKICAFGDPQVFYDFENAGDNFRNITSNIQIVITST